LTTTAFDLIRSCGPSRKTLALAAALLAASMLAGCDSTPKSLSPEERAAAAPAQHEEYAKLGYRVEWRGFPSLSGGARIERIEVLGDVVATQDSSAELSILEARSGERRWSEAVANPLTKFVGLNRDGKRLIVSSESQAYFYDVDTGSLLSKQSFAENVNTRPVQVAEILVFGATNGRVLGHLMLNGFQQWGAITSGSVEADPVLLGQNATVGIVSSGGDVAVYDGVTGSLRGGARVYNGAEAPLAASDEALFVASRDHSLYAFSADQVRQLWRVRTEAPLRHAPTYHDGRVYCDMGATGLTAFDAKTGKPVWSNKGAHGTVVAIRGGRPIVWDGSQAATVDPGRGGIVESVALSDVMHIRVDQFVDGNMYLVSGSGVVSKLSPRK